MLGYLAHLCMPPQADPVQRVPTTQSGKAPPRVSINGDQLKVLAAVVNANIRMSFLENLVQANERLESLSTLR